MENKEDQSSKKSSDVIRNQIANFRMYEKALPEVGSLVMCRVMDVYDKEKSVTLALLEYGGAEGLMLASEVTQKRMRSLTQHIRPGQQVVLIVIRTDEKKGYIDLSKRRVNEQDEDKCHQQYSKSKFVHSILSYVASAQQSASLQELYEKIGWPLYHDYTHAVDGFEAIMKGENKEFIDKVDLPHNVKKLFMDTLTAKMETKAVRIQADIQVTCFSYEGVEGIKPALKAAENVGKTQQEDTVSEEGEASGSLKIHLVKSPEYILLLTCRDGEKGILTLNKAISACQQEVKKYGGDCQVTAAPRIIS